MLKMKRITTQYNCLIQCLKARHKNNTRVVCTQTRIENYCPIRTIEFHLDMLILWAHLTKGQKITACSQ